MKEKIASDFKKLKNAHPPLFAPLLPFIRLYGKRLFAREKSGDGLTVEKVKILAFDGEKISALLYAPERAEQCMPCLVLFHGGGYALPAGKYHYALAREYVKRANCKVFFVNYRLSPKYKYPTPVDDGCLAYAFLLKNAERWGIIPEKIAVGGDSAGGALAAAVSIFAQEKGLQPPCAQLLIYPACGPFFQSEEYSSAPMCSEKDLKKFMRLYLKKGERESVYIAPILGVNADTPPSFIEIAEVDYLRVCGEKYAEKLQEFGVEFILRETKGTIHAYDMVLGSSITKKSIEKRVEFLRYIFGKDRGKD